MPMVGSVVFEARHTLRRSIFSQGSHFKSNNAKLLHFRPFPLKSTVFVERRIIHDLF